MGIYFIVGYGLNKDVIIIVYIYVWFFEMFLDVLSVEVVIR